LSNGISNVTFNCNMHDCNDITLILITKTPEPKENNQTLIHDIMTFPQQ